MAVGSADLPVFATIDGVRIGVANAGIKQTERADITLIELTESATVAGVFTTNAFCAAPVQICQKHLQVANANDSNESSKGIRYLLVNTGNANAGTGQEGYDDAMACCQAVADLAGVDVEQVLPFSTGVIGEALPVDKIAQALPAAFESLPKHAWADAAPAIMTTDTRPKGATSVVSLSVGEVKISGISKGAGMIKPNMATMLAYVAIDAKSSPSVLQEMLSASNRLSFNRITVDGDTSTNDSAMLIASGTSGIDIDEIPEDDREKLQSALDSVFIELAQLIIKDAEGANKFVHVSVREGADEQECEQVAYTVAESPLVKTALFASDPNWGRILAAVGRAGLPSLDVEKVSIKLNDVLIAENGGRAKSYTEAQGEQALSSDEIVIDISLGRGDAAATVWTCDLSHDYVRINAEYRT